MALNSLESPINRFYPKMCSENELHFRLRSFVGALEKSLLTNCAIFPSMKEVNMSAEILG